VPIWQTSPALPLTSLVNFDILSHPGSSGGCRALLTRETAVIDVIVNLQKVEHDEDNETNAIFNFILSMGQNRHKVSTYSGDPASSMVYPVFSDFGPNRTLVGVLNTNLYWSFYFADVLPPNAKGIIAVLENSRKQSFTYQIDGPDVKYVGLGDLHEEEFNNMEFSEDVSSTVKGLAGPATRAYTTVDLDDEYCTYKLRVYPSSKTEDNCKYNIGRAVLVEHTFSLFTIFLPTSQTLPASLTSSWVWWL